MSHQPERKEKNCLNCGTFVQGRYCHVCGQENVITKESFFSLLRHFIYDVLHFDSKFFDTLKFILFRPGYIAKQYIQGKRASFLHPIRMYLFTSAIFFLIFFSLKSTKINVVNFDTTVTNVSYEDRMEIAANVKQGLAKAPDDTALQGALKRLQDTTAVLNVMDLTYGSNHRFIGWGDSSVKTVRQYDSMQNILPSQKKDGLLKRQLMRKIIAIDAKYRGDIKGGIEHFSELFIHKLPYLLFLSLPFFALILKLLYIRRKTYFYSDHAVFTLYHYIFSFILLLIIFLFASLADWTQFKLFKFLIICLVIAWPVYLFIAIKKFYGQGSWKTFSKFLLLNGLGIIVLLLLFAGFLFFTIFQL